VAEHVKLQGWQADPFGVHEKRYFSDGLPTKLVRDGDAESYDAPPAGDAASADTPTETEPPATVAAAPDAADQADEEAASLAGVGGSLAEAAPAGARPPEDEPEGVFATDSATADAGAGLSSGALDAELNLTGLGVLRRPPRGVVYAAAAVAAVLVVIAIVAITGGFSPHPKPGTFGAALERRRSIPRRLQR
jgi:hypothetical protein